ncbi:MAG: hypothetical protein KatS3mg010_1492 [Acidimicrobiia bacterium]|nr:MAG: hypothetical protein KatS3mg010_1492 [Acidimicrobiia bacterium]
MTRATSSAGGERLRHVVVGTELQADDALHLAVARGQEDDGKRVRRLQPAADLESVEVRQADVEHHEPRRVVAYEPQRVLARAGLHHAEPVAPQVQLDEVGDVRFVVDDEDRAAVHHMRDRHVAGGP